MRRTHIIEISGEGAREAHNEKLSSYKLVTESVSQSQRNVPKCIAAKLTSMLQSKNESLLLRDRGLILAMLVLEKHLQVSSLCGKRELDDVQYHTIRTTGESESSIGHYF